MENTFWHIMTMTHISGESTGDGIFVELFKRSFQLYVESGTRKKIEEAIDSDLLRNEGKHRLVTNSKDFKEKFYMLITEHLLRKFHCFFVVLDTANHFLCLHTAHPGDPEADQAQAQALELKQLEEAPRPEKEKKCNLLQRLKLKINSRGRRL